jgi:hypothetical protein
MTLRGLAAIEIALNPVNMNESLRAKMASCQVNPMKSCVWEWFYFEYRGRFTENGLKNLGSLQSIERCGVGFHSALSNLDTDYRLSKSLDCSLCELVCLLNSCQRNRPSRQNVNPPSQARP